MKIFVTGGTGFVGRNLISRLIGEGHTVTVLSRSEKAPDRLPKGTCVVQGDPTVGAFVFLTARCEISGPVNLTSPNPIRNKELAKALGKAMHRPAFLPAPGFMLKLILGEFGSVLLEGQRVIPKKLMDSGYVFIYPEIDGALGSLIMD